MEQETNINEITEFASIEKSQLGILRKFARVIESNRNMDHLKAQVILVS